MDKKVLESALEPVDPVAEYLRVHGIPGAELPPDMHRELVRLLSESDSALMDQPEIDREDRITECNHRRERRQGMLAFEMYLAAWIAREGICDRPRPKNRRPRRKP